jgi:hypothetical protein
VPKQLNGWINKIDFSEKHEGDDRRCCCSFI